jgi:Transposase IS116/IS110/IS902 family
VDWAVPKQNSSGGKDKLGSITKQGDRYLRSLFTTGATVTTRPEKMVQRTVVRGTGFMERWPENGAVKTPSGPSRRALGRKNASSPARRTKCVHH